MKPALAEYLIIAGEAATVLCSHHTRAFEATTTALGMPIEVYLLGDDAVVDEEPVTCQACYLTAVELPLNMRH